MPPSCSDVESRCSCHGPPAVDADLPTNTPPKYRDGTPKPKAQRNFTDPDSRLMVRDGAFVQAYNGQIAVDEENQIIVAAALSNQGPDAEYFEHVLQALDTPAQRVLFIDDNAINVAAAATLGMHTRRVAGVEGARQAFVELGLLSQGTP